MKIPATDGNSTAKSAELTSGFMTIQCSHSIGMNERGLVQ